jgi:hypothetical protein
MRVEIRRERLTELNLSNLLGHDPDLVTHHIDCIRRSTATWIGYADGVEACAIGAIPLSVFSEEAYIWMIHSKICEQNPLRFIRWSRRVMDELLELYPVIVGLCYCDNAGGMGWLEWLGAKFDCSVRTPDGHYGFRIEKWHQ